MKTVKEKAKAYDKVINKLQNLINNANKQGHIIVRVEDIENSFPELKESEDEKARKALVELVKCNERSGYTLLNNVSTSSMLAWLEKQGEQKSVNNIEPKFKVGDSIKTTNEEPLTITKIDDKGYWSEDLFICSFDEECIWDLAEQKPADKIKPKFKVGYRITKSSNKSCPVHSSTDDTICEVAEIHDTCYILNTKEGRIQVPFEWQDHYELVIHTWSEEDEKNVPRNYRLV